MSSKFDKFRQVVAHKKMEVVDTATSQPNSTTSTSPPSLAEIDHQIEDYELTLKKYSTGIPTDDRGPIITGLPEFIFDGICMSDIARTMGMSLGGVSRIFNGDRKARKFVLTAIAATYTDGNIEQVQEIIRKRVIRRLRQAKAGREKISVEMREKLLRNAGIFQ
jgi:AraC-like DNA-binding protein